LTKRALPLALTIDPGFVNRRRIQTVLDLKNIRLVDRLIDGLPKIFEWERKCRIDHIYTRVLLDVLKLAGIQTLEEILATEQGRMFCSTETVKGFDQIYDSPRATNEWVPRELINGRCRLRS
jgi:hypothetical protein